MNKMRNYEQSDSEFERHIELLGKLFFIVNNICENYLLTKHQSGGSRFLN